jgi:hypothetical protein
MKVTNKKGKNLRLLQIKEDQGTKELRNISVESGRSVVVLYSQQKKRKKKRKNGNGYKYAYNSKDQRTKGPKVLCLIFNL